MASVVISLQLGSLLGQIGAPPSPARSSVLANVHAGLAIICRC